MKRTQIGILLMVLAATMLAFSLILMKIIPQVTILLPKDVAIWRFSIATPFFWAFYLINQRGVEKRVIKPWRFLGLGCVFALASFCAVFALSKLASSLYVIIVYIYPSLVVAYSLLFSGRVPKLYWLGLPLTLIGLMLITYPFGNNFVVDPVGIIITIINAFAHDGSDGRWIDHDPIFGNSYTRYPNWMVVLNVIKCFRYANAHSSNEYWIAVLRCCSRISTDDASTSINRPHFDHISR